MSVHRLKERPPQGEKVMIGEAIGRIGCVSCLNSVYLLATGNPSVRTGFKNDMVEISEELGVPVFVRTSPTESLQVGPEQSDTECSGCPIAGNTLALRQYVDLIVTT